MVRYMDDIAMRPKQLYLSYQSHSKTSSFIRKRNRLMKT